MHFSRLAIFAAAFAVSVSAVPTNFKRVAKAEPEPAPAPQSVTEYGDYGDYGDYGSYGDYAGEFLF